MAKLIFCKTEPRKKMLLERANFGLPGIFIAFEVELDAKMNSTFFCENADKSAALSFQSDRVRNRALAMNKIPRIIVL